MADNASRLWNLFNKELLSHFNVTCPQVWYWKLAALSPRMHSALISSLCKRRSTKGLFHLEPKHTNVASVNGKASAGHNMDTFLDKVRDPVLFLQFFTPRVRSGLLAHKGEPVRSRTAEAYLRAVGQTFSNVGIGDSRLNKYGSIYHRLQRQLRGWTKSDGPPKRLKPINIGLLHHTFAALPK